MKGYLSPSNIKLPNFTKKRIESILLLGVFMLITAASQIDYSVSASVNAPNIRGRVIDGKTGIPIQGASILIWRKNYAFKVIFTDSNGFFSARVGDGYYTIYAYCDRKETPGMDYMPAKRQVFLERGSLVTLTFALLPAASFFIRGEVRFVESSLSATRVRFWVLDSQGNKITDKHTISEYGTPFWNQDVKNLNLNATHVIVPAGTAFIVKVGATITQQGKSFYHEFMINGKNGRPFKLAQGACQYVDIKAYSTKFNLENVNTLMNTAFSLLWELSNAGFLVNVERKDLRRATSLIEAAIESLERESYDESFAYLRNAYIIIKTTTEQLQQKITVSKQTPFIVPFLFVFVSLSLSYIMIEHKDLMIEWTKKGRLKKVRFPLHHIVAIGIYIILLLIFLKMFPGCHFVSPLTYIVFSLTIFITGLGFILISSKTLENRKSEFHSIAFWSALFLSFSLAMRNLKRRGMRTILSIINILVLVSTFITLTSASPVYSLIYKTSVSQHAVETLLIKKMSNIPESHFIPISSSIITWLESNPNVTLIVPKAENVPKLDQLDTLYTETGSSVPIYGVLGILPSAEAKLRSLNRIIIEGEYLQDDDYNGILISSTLARRLGIKVGDKIYIFNQRFFVRGLFDENIINIMETDEHTHLVPYRLVLGGALGNPTPEICDSDMFIITTFKRALTLPGIYMSRVNIQLSNPDDMLNFAKIVTLIYEYDCFALLKGKLHQLGLGFQLEEKGIGLFIFLLILVVLNIMTSRLSAIEERKREIAIMSMLGLNPTHIVGIFLAESIMIGFIGGGLGYLLGISSYKILSETILGTLPVREKVSAEWGILATVLSIIVTVMATIFPALKVSTITTPSFLRRWKLSGKKKSEDKPWILDLPAKISPAEVEIFLGFLMRKFRKMGGGMPERIEILEYGDKETSDGSLHFINFNYAYTETAHPLVTKNKLIVYRPIDQEYFVVRLQSDGIKESVHRTASIVRRIIFEWDALPFNIVTPLGASLNQLYTLIKAFKPKTIFLTEEIDKNRLERLRTRLRREGLRFPRILIYSMNPNNIDECMKTAEKIVSQANVVCVSDGPNAVCVALTITAKKQNKRIFYVIDTRPQEIRMKDPFKVSKIVDVSQSF